MPSMRFLPLGLDAMLVELDDLDQTLALLASLRRDPFPGIAEIVPGARTLLIRLSAQAEAGREALAGELCSRGLDEIPQASDARITIPVLYDGEDIEEVAALTGMTQEEYMQMMLSGGRSAEGNRYIGENGDAQAHNQPQGKSHPKKEA